MRRAPKRSDKVVDDNGYASRNMAVFMESAPNDMDAITDLDLESADPDVQDIEDKINELLAALRTATLLKSE